MKKENKRGDKIAKRIHFSFPPREGGLLRLSRAFSVTLKGRFGMGEDGCGRKVVSSEE
jgi:hypothetical protein